MKIIKSSDAISIIGKQTIAKYLCPVLLHGA